jgi:hypothetical protein
MARNCGSSAVRERDPPRPLVGVDLVLLEQTHVTELYEIELQLHG